MNYEQKYKEALNKIKPLYEQAKRDGNPIWSTYEYLIPELRESEDERIRKALIPVVDRLLGTINFPFTEEQVLNWFEKQKEQKPDLKFIQRSWYMDGYIDGEFKREPRWNLKAGKGGPKYEKNEKYGQPLEQKPAEKEDYSGLNDLERAILRGFLAAGVENVSVEIIKETANECLAQIKPAEWSEEDSDILRDAICATDILAKDFKKDNPHLAKTLMVAKGWLESLPTRFAFSIKQEWGEFDEDCLKRAIWYVENPAPSVVKDTNLVLWLKSLPLNLKKKNEDTAKLCSNEWSEEDEKMNEEIRQYLKQDRAEFPGRSARLNRMIGWLISIRPQPKQEWSGEDEKIKQSIIKDIEWERNYTVATTGKVIEKYNEQINWLKSLPERFNLQPKQEWSDEDEHCIELLDTIINSSALIPKNRIKCHNFLKSLRPDSYKNCNSRWKPSEEQMEELGKAKDIYMKSSSGIASLYYDLITKFK